MKKILIWIAIIIIVILALGVLRDQIIKTALTITISQVTGAPVHMDGFSLGVFNQSVKITGFKVYNPKGFSRGILVDLPKIGVVYDLKALLKKELHFPSIEIEIKELGLEKNKDGKLNVDSFKVVKQEKKKGQSPKQMPFQIDLLKLDMGKIVSRDYGSGKEPVVKVYDINIHRSYKNITSAQVLGAFILAEPMKAAGIKGAKIYSVAMLSGTAFLPVGLAFTFAGNDSAEQDFSVSFDRAYAAGLALLKQKGQVVEEDKPAGNISASVDSADITFKVIQKPDNNIQVVVSARKYLLPKPEIAGGILYEVAEKLK